MDLPAPVEDDLHRQKVHAEAAPDATPDVPDDGTGQGMLLDEAPDVGLRVPANPDDGGREALPADERRRVQEVIRAGRTARREEHDEGRPTVPRQGLVERADLVHRERGGQAGAGQGQQGRPGGRLRDPHRRGSMRKTRRSLSSSTA